MLNAFENSMYGFGSLFNEDTSKPDSEVQDYLPNKVPTNETPTSEISG